MKWMLLFGLTSYWGVRGLQFVRPLPRSAFNIFRYSEKLVLTYFRYAVTVLLQRFYRFLAHVFAVVCTFVLVISLILVV